jgi:micrococcal nuclease
MRARTLIIAAILLLSAFQTTAARAGCVDINTAPREELTLIVHIGQVRAAEALRLRAVRPFSSVDDLRRISGIGDARIADIKAQGLACVGGGGGIADGGSGDGGGGPDESACRVGGFSALVSRVRDGDTIVVGDVPIRLQGIAAPELNERGGPRATRAMRSLVLDKEVWCDLDGKRTFDRCSAICYIGVRDVGAVMVRRGLARDCPHFSGGRYERLERAAADEGALISQFYPLPGYCH